jgi:hypothetical protein
MCGLCGFGINTIFIIKDIMEELKRCCPSCDGEILYKSKLGYEAALKNESVCRKCATSGDKNPMFGRTGDKNPMFGKKHSIETKQKLSKIKLGKKHTKETIEKMKLLFGGDKNPMNGKTVYDIWVVKHGVEIANQKMISYKEKQSNNNMGVNNPMYGKPSPIGSGNGWSGWYKGWYFRSLRELTYMVKVIERFNLKWVSGESNQHKIEYIDYKGSNRNYFPDFIIDDKYVIECKPKKLWNSDNVVRKTEAALIYCELNGLVYKKRDIGILSNLEIKYLYENGYIKFLDRYEIKYLKNFG